MLVRKSAAVLALGLLVGLVGISAPAPAHAEGYFSISVGNGPAYYGHRDGWRHNNWRHERWERERWEHAHWARPYYPPYYGPHYSRSRIVYVAPYTSGFNDVYEVPNVAQQEITYNSPAPEPYCREYQSDVRVGNRIEHGYGTACQQPDGSWKKMD